MIGVNTQIASPTGSSAGIGFAVPVDIVNRIVPQLIGHGRVIRPGFGVNLLSDNITRQLRIKQGVVLLQVSKGGSADQAGLRGTTQTRDGRVRLGDIIVKVNGHTITDRNSLLDVLEKYNVGDKVEVTYLRNEKMHTASIQLQPL